MIYLLYGDDSFSSKSKLKIIKQKFLDKHSADNLIVKQGCELTTANLDNIFRAQTLLGGAHLIILEDVLSGADALLKEELLQIFQSLPDETTVVVHETQNFDGRQKLFKFLNQPKQAQKFDVPPPAALYQRVARLAQDKSLNISPVMVRYLVDRAENDLWSINNELDKLSALAVGRAVSQEDIDRLISTNIRTNVFELLEHLTNNNLKSAHQIWQNSLEQGEDEIKFMGAIAYQLRNLIRIFDLSATGLTLPNITRQTGLPYFVVRRCLNQVKRVNRGRLVTAYQRLVSTDHKIKTGAIRPADGLDLMIAQRI